MSSVRNLTPLVYFAFCALEGIWALASIWFSPVSSPGPLRQALAALVALAMVVFVLLAVWEWRGRVADRSPIYQLLDRRVLVLFLALLVGAGMVLAYLLIFSPLSPEFLFPYALRLRPVGLWAGLVFAQFLGLAVWLRRPDYWRRAWVELLHHPRLESLLAARNSPRAGLVLLGISLVIGLTKVYYGRFVDEADTLTVGWLISLGYRLYHDVFSHHFPFPYYWAALVVALVGNSFIAVRISLLLLQLGLLAVSMRVTRFYLAIGLSAVVWNLINQFHRGQEAIYPTFESLFMLAVFILLLWMLVKRPVVRSSTLILVGALISLALLTDPLMVYPGAVALAALFVSGLRRSRTWDWRDGWRRLLWAALAGGLVLAVFGAQLLATQTAQDFYRSTIWFNAEIYAKYVDANPNRLGNILQYIASGLNILDPRWYQHVSPFIPIETYRSVKLNDENLYAAWIFAGFLSRISILMCAFGLVLQRRAAAGIFLYIFSAAMIVRREDGLYAMGFALISIFAAFYLLVEIKLPVWLRALRLRWQRLRWPAWRLARAGWMVVLVLIGSMHLWSAFRGGFYLIVYGREVLDSRHVTMYRKLERTIRELTCNQTGLELSVYPINPIVNFVTEIPPASKYVFMYPWVAEVGNPELIEELRANPSAFVWINTARKSDSPEGVATYMADVIEFLNEEYVVVGVDYWMSPNLAEHCSAAPLEAPLIEENEVD